MLPTLQPLLPAFSSPAQPLRRSALALVLAAALPALPALAQQAANPADSAEKAQDQQPIDFEADKVEYHDADDTIIALGNVVMRRGEQSLRADKVTWNSTSGKIVAEGNIRMVDEDGNQLFTDSVELDEEFRAGAMNNMLLALREGGRLASTSGERDDAGNIVLGNAAYSACDVEDREHCPKTPSWRVTANKVLYSAEEKIVRFKDARLELFGMPLVPLPRLQLTTDGRATSGFLVPRISISPSNGLELAPSYYWRISENRDLTGTLDLYSDAPPMVSSQYRALTGKGAYQISGYATRSRQVDLTAGAVSHNFRGYLAANGRFQFDPAWSLTFSGRRASDRTFLRRYDISRDDRLRSTVNLERIDARSYLSIAGWATQTMRVGVSQKQVPLALPAIDYRLRLDSPVLGGKVEFQANSLAILRSLGQDSQRAFVSARWDMRRLTTMGQEITLTALARGDVYHSDGNLLTSTVIYRGRAGWQSRAAATAAVDVKWPFIGKFAGGTQVITPRFQVVASPTINNLRIPNEDSRAIDLEDSNLFALNRFPGYDRIEDGVRVTYGLDWQLERPRWRIKSTVGQSYRMTDKPTLLPNGTGLTSRTSDIVGRTEVRFRDVVKLTHRFRLDKDSLSVRRNEFDATVGSERTYGEIGYLRLNRNIAPGLEDLQDREELRVAGRVAFARYWSVFGSGVFNLTDRKEDPTNTSDGFDPLRTRIGIAYQDDCLELAFTWRRDYFRTGDAQKGNSYLVTFALKNLGFR